LNLLNWDSDFLKDVLDSLGVCADELGAFPVGPLSVVLELGINEEGL